MRTDLDVFHELQAAGASPADAYRAAKMLGLTEIVAIRMLREVFGLDLVRAKEVTLVASGEADSLAQHEERLRPMVEAALKQIESK